MSETLISTFENGTNDPLCTPRPTGFDNIGGNLPNYGWYKSIHFDTSTFVSSFFDTVTDTENKLTIAPQGAHDGSGGLVYTHSSVTASYGKLDISVLGGGFFDHFTNFWIDFSKISVASGKTMVVYRQQNSTNNTVFQIELQGNYPNTLTFYKYIDGVKTIIGRSSSLPADYNNVYIEQREYGNGGINYIERFIAVNETTLFHTTGESFSNSTIYVKYGLFGCVETNDTTTTGTLKFDSIYSTSIACPPVPSTLAKKSGNYGAAFYAARSISFGQFAYTEQKNNVEYYFDVNIDNLNLSNYSDNVTYLDYFNTLDSSPVVFYATGDTSTIMVFVRYTPSTGKTIYLGIWDDTLSAFSFSSQYSILSWKNIGLKIGTGDVVTLFIDGVEKETISPSVLNVTSGIDTVNFGIQSWNIPMEDPARDYGFVYIDNVIERDIPALIPQTITPTYNYFNQLELPGLILCTPTKDEIYPLGLAYGIKNVLRYNALSDLEFKFPRVEGAEEIYDAIQGKMVILLNDIGYYLIDSASEETDGGTLVKQVNCHSLESEMIARRLTGFEGTYEFSDLLNTIIKLAPTWSMGSIATSLLGVYRTFKSNNSTLYNFLMKDVEKAYGCIFLFDTFTKTVTALKNEIPAPSTNIYVSMENLIKKTEFKEITEEICTALYCYGGDGLDITGVNPLGTKVIYNFIHFKTTAWMTQGLIDALTVWEDAVVAQQAGYANKVTRLNILNANMLILVDAYDELTTQYQSMITTRNGLLEQDPPGDTTDIDAKIAAQKLKISSAVADIASKQMAIDSLQVELRKISNRLAFSQGVVFANMEKNVIAMGEDIEFLKGDWEAVYKSASGSWPYFDQALMDSSKEGIYNLFRDAEDANDDLLELIDNLFSGTIFTVPSGSVKTSIVQAINGEIVVLDDIYSALQKIIPNTTTTISIDEIRTKLIAYKEIIYFEPNMTEAQYLELTSYIYENTYTNANIKTYTGKTPKETMENFQTYSQQLYDQSLTVSERVAVPRFEFKGDYTNLLALKEFTPFTDELDLGKSITVGKDNDLDIIAVLLELDITYDSPQDFNLTFSNSLRLDNSRYIYGDLMGEAAQLGSNLSALAAGGTAIASVANTFMGTSFMDESFTAGLDTGALLEVPTLGGISSGTTPGHKIVVEDSFMPQRAGLSFGLGFSVQDDVINNRTIVTSLEGEGGGGGITLASDEHGLSLAGTVLDSYLLSTHAAIGTNGNNVWIGSGGDSVSGTGTQGSYNISLGMVALYNNTSGYYNAGLGTYSLAANTIGANNSAVGSYSLYSNTSGSYNVAFGYYALHTSNGDETVGIGAYALQYNNANTGNVAIGAYAMASYLTAQGCDNVAVGYGALNGNTSGRRNSAVGKGALYYNTDGDNNIAMGTDALHSSTLGDDNVGVGYLALYHNTEGYSNTAIGTNSLHANIDGNYNIAMGEGTLEKSTTSDKNIAIGSFAAGDNTTGTSNIAIGYSALHANTTGDKNTVVGSDAAQDINITGGSAGQNTLIGYNSGRGITTGVNNTMLGANTNVGNVSNSIVIADGAGLVRFYSDATYKGKLTTAITTAKTLTLTSADNYNLTIPRSGTVGMVVISASEPTGLYAGMIWIDT